MLLIRTIRPVRNAEFAALLTGLFVLCLVYIFLVKFLFQLTKCLAVCSIGGIGRSQAVVDGCINKGFFGIGFSYRLVVLVYIIVTIESKPTRKDVYVATYLLLGNHSSAQKHCDNMSDEKSSLTVTDVQILENGITFVPRLLK